MGALDHHRLDPRPDRVVKVVLSDPEKTFETAVFLLGCDQVNVVPEGHQFHASCSCFFGDQLRLVQWQPAPPTPRNRLSTKNMLYVHCCWVTGPTGCALCSGRVRVGGSCVSYCSDCRPYCVHRSSSHVMCSVPLPGMWLEYVGEASPRVSGMMTLPQLRLWFRSCGGGAVLRAHVGRVAPPYKVWKNAHAREATAPGRGRHVRMLRRRVGRRAHEPAAWHARLAA